MNNWIYENLPVGSHLEKAFVRMIVPVYSGKFNVTALLYLLQFPFLMFQLRLSKKIGLCLKRNPKIRLILTYLCWLVPQPHT